MSLRHPRLSGVAVLLLSLALATACNKPVDGPTEAKESFDDVVSEASEEGALVVYSAYNAEVTQELADAFSEEYDVDVEVVRQASADLNARFAAEADAKSVGADVLWQPDPVFAADAVDKDWLAPLSAEQIPNLDLVDAEHRGDGFVSVLEQPWGIAYNTKIVSADDVPSSWESLAEGEELPGGLLVAAPENSVATAGVYNFWLNSFGKGYFSDLQGVQSYQMGDSVSNAVQQVAAGEVGAFVPAPLSTVSTIQDSGAPVEVIIPDDTTGFGMLASVSRTAQNPNAARLFVQFLLSDEGQAIAVSDFAVPVVDGVSGGAPRPSGYVPTDNVETSKRLDEIVRLVKP